MRRAEKVFAIFFKASYNLLTLILGERFMKKIWLLLFAIVLGGCNMSDSANEASVEEETVLTEEEKQNIKENWNKIELTIKNYLDERLTVTLNNCYFSDFSTKKVITIGRDLYSYVYTEKDDFSENDFNCNKGSPTKRQDFTSTAYTFIVDY